MIRLFQSKEFLAFLITGGCAAVVNFGSRILYDVWVAFSIAIILAYITGMITAFWLARLFVFKKSTLSIGRSASFFILVNIIAVVQTWGISMFLAYYLLPQMGIATFKSEIAHAVGVAVPVFTSYLGHKYWSFR